MISIPEWVVDALLWSPAVLGIIAVIIVIMCFANGLFSTYARSHKLRDVLPAILKRKIK